jgi:fatty acid synthase
MLERDITSGIVRPLKTKIFPAVEIGEALRHLGSGKHIGKVLLQMRDDETNEFLTPSLSLIDSRVYCNPKLSYVSNYNQRY